LLKNVILYLLLHEHWCRLNFDTIVQRTLLAPNILEDSPSNSFELHLGITKSDEMIDGYKAFTRSIINPWVFCTPMWKYHILAIYKKQQHTKTYERINQKLFQVCKAQQR